MIYLLEMVVLRRADGTSHHNSGVTGLFWAPYPVPRTCQDTIHFKTFNWVYMRENLNTTQPTKNRQMKIPK